MSLEPRETIKLPKNSSKPLLALRHDYVGPPRPISEDGLKRIQDGLVSRTPDIDYDKIL
jgi:hypothetical protein